MSKRDHHQAQGKGAAVATQPPPVAPPPEPELLRVRCRVCGPGSLLRDGKAFGPGAELEMAPRELDDMARHAPGLLERI